MDHKKEPDRSITSSLHPNPSPEAKLGQMVDPANLSIEELRDLVRELQLKQQQLEKQNDELRRAQPRINPLGDHAATTQNPEGIEDNQGQEMLNTQARVLENMGEGVIVCREDGHILYTNRAFDAMFDYQPGELTGIHVTVLNNSAVPENAQFVSASLEQLQTKGSWSGEFSNIKKDGTPFITYVRISTLKISDKIFFVGVQEDITQRKQIEESLRESEDRFRTLAETTTAAIFVYQGPQLRYVNPAALTITDYSEEALMGMNFWDIIHPDFQETVRSRGLARQEGQEFPSQYEIKILTKNGQERWLDFNAGVITLGGETAILGTAFDVTQRRQAETERERLLTVEREQRQMSESLEEIFLALAAQTDRDTVLHEILQQAQNIVPSTGSNMMLLDDNDRQLHIVHWRGYETFITGSLLNDLRQSLTDLPLAAQAVRSRQPVYVHDTRQNDRWVNTPKAAWIRSWLGVPLCLGDRVLGLLRFDDASPDAFSTEDIMHLQPLAHAAAIALESTQLYDQLQQELVERIQIEQALRRTTARNAAILDALPDSIFYFNHTGIILDHRIVGTSDLLFSALVGMVAGNDLSRSSSKPSTLADLFREKINETLISNKVEIFEFQITSALGEKNYEARFVKASSSEVLTIVRDITGLTQAQRQAIRTERLAALGQLIASLAHEINNPMQAIQANVDLVLDFPLGEEAREQSLQIVRQEMIRLKNISQQLLNYTRPKETGREQVLVSGVVERALALARNQLEQSGVQFSTHFQSVPAVLAEADQLLQVFLNLIINAAEVAPAHNAQLKISIYSDGSDVAVSFTNNGPAIPAESLTYIFEPFYTTKEKGSGLGLWISHMIIAQHGGALSVENVTEHEGVIFTVELPAVGAGDRPYKKG